MPISTRVHAAARVLLRVMVFAAVLFIRDFVFCFFVSYCGLLYYVVLRSIIFCISCVVCCALFAVCAVCSVYQK